MIRFVSRRRVALIMVSGMRLTRPSKVFFELAPSAKTAEGAFAFGKQKSLPFMWTCLIIRSFLYKFER